MDVDELVTTTGRHKVSSLPGSVVLIEIEGHGEGSFAQTIIKHFDAQAKANGFVQAFYRMGGMVTYDSALRTDLTAWHRANRNATRSLQVFFKSKLVAMGVAVANVALGNMITSHRSEESLDAAMKEAIKVPTSSEQRSRAG